MAELQMEDSGTNTHGDSTMMEVSCHSDRADENETIERQCVELADIVNNDGVSDMRELTGENLGDTDEIVNCASTSDGALNDVDNHDAGCSRVSRTSNVEEAGPSQKGDSPLPTIQATMKHHVSNLSPRCSIVYNSETVESKCKPKRSKGMMTIRRQHSEKLMHNMDQMRRDNFLCDVDLEAAGGVVFRAHRSVLAAACSYFRAMFSSGLMEGKESRVKMVHLSPQTMSTILQFIYTGDLQVGLDEVQELMVVADMLQMEEVIEGCTQLMHDEIEPANALGIYRFAEAHNCTAMSKMAESYVKQNFVEIVKGEEFLALPLSTLTHFLSSEGLEVDSEMQVFESAVRWLFHDPPQRRKYVFEVLSHIRLGLLHPDLMSLRAASTICGKDPPLGVALAAIRMEVEERVKGQHSSRYEDIPRRGAKKHIVVLGGCRREPTPSPYRSAGRSSISSSSHPGEVLCAAVEVFDVFHKEWLWQGDASHSKSADINGRGPPPLLNPRILPGVSTIGGIIYVVGGELESQILANVEALDARACILGKANKTAEAESEVRSIEGVPKAEAEQSRGRRGSPEEGRMLEEEEVKGEEEEEWVEKGGEEEEEDAARGEKRRSDEGGLRTRRKRGRHLDPVRWARVSSMIVPRCEFGLCACGGRLYAIGGWVGSDVDSSVESYDPILDEWRMEGHLPKSCSGMGAISYEGLIYVVGGCTRHRRHLSQLLCLEPPRSHTSNASHKTSWCSDPVRLASMGTPRSQMGTAVLLDSLYVIGGTNEGTDALRSVERYSFSENKWYEVCPLREARVTPSVVALDGRLYAIGGTNSYHMFHYQTQVSLKTVEMYDPVADTWSPVPSLPHARGEAGAVVI